MANGNQLTKFPSPSGEDRDTESIRDRLLGSIDFFTQEWTDRNPSDFGVVLLDLFAFVADGLHFYIDQRAREFYLDLLKSRQSLVNLFKLIDFELRSATPASVELVFTLDEVQTEDVTIPAGTLVSTGPLADDAAGVSFETDSELVIPAGSLGNEQTGGSFDFGVLATEGESGNEQLGTSDGSQFQEFTISARVITPESLQVFVDEGSGDVLWTEVDSFAASGPNDEVYTVSRDEEEFVTVRFGDNLAGKIPQQTAVIRSEFRTLPLVRGGTNVFGNVGANTINNLDDTILLDGNPLDLTVNNPEAAQGGEGRQSIEEARELGPKSIRALERAVTNEDYEFFTDQLGGVAKVKAVRGDSPFEVKVFVVPEGGGDPSAALLATIEDELDDRRMLGTDLTITGPNLVTIQLEGTVQTLGNSLVSQVESRVVAALEGFFDETTGQVDFGTAVRFSDIVSLVDNQEGVDFFQIDRLTRKPTPVLEVRSGDWTVGPIEISPVTVAETWTVTFISSTEFTVEGSISGIQVTTGQLDTEYTSDNDEVVFTVSSGTQPPVQGDRFTFVTSPLRGSVAVQDNEFPVLETTDNIEFEGGV